MTISRRVFLAGAAGVGAGWLLLDWAQVDAALAHAAHAVQQRPAPPFTHLAPDEAAELAAVAARILPTTDTPGATEAGVIYFIDRALGAEQRKALPTMRAGITDLRRRAARRKPGTTTFAALPAADQDAILAEIEHRGVLPGDALRHDGGDVWRSIARREPGRRRLEAPGLRAPGLVRGALRLL
jgi:gluconate 2-dehydrogenase gamma chain